jgi:hypothetical protein
MRNVDWDYMMRSSLCLGGAMEMTICMYIRTQSFMMRAIYRVSDFIVQGDI